MDNEENILTCEHGARRVTKTDSNNILTLISDEYQNNRLNSPNDICVHSSGAIFFTDPPYGIYDSKKESSQSRIEGFPGKKMYGGCYVFKCSPPSRELIPIVTDMTRPNGIAFSLDEKKLYISNTGINKYMRAYDVDKDLNATNPQEFSRPNYGDFFDGFRIDADNNIWSSCGKGIKCFSSKGEVLGYLDVPEVVSNLEFSGKDGNILFITATSSLYMIEINQIGAKFVK